MDEEKPLPGPPRRCPRCYSDNTRFCYYNNYSLFQPRYTCKNCRRPWTHGGTLRNIPLGGTVRKTKRPRIDQPSVAQVVPVETQQVNHHQPVENHLGSLPEIHGDMVFPGRSDVEKHSP